ncbi:MarR family transcriptional regulator [Lentibacillus sp. N15]|uniref:MarR family winged helix-turn-helix transcriptional regulator n=1 Tax=Lentibacillus songyuanensis TaxID=3136161 RepID=UPI0031BA808C
MNKENNKLDPAMELMHSFWKLQKSMMHCFKITVANNGLSVPMFVVLMAIAHHEKEMMQKDVQMKTNFPKSTLSQAVEGLVQAGLIQRQQREENRREIHLSISQKGRDLMQQLPSQDDSIHYKFRQAVESLSDQQMQELLAINKQIASYLYDARSDSTC